MIPPIPPPKALKPSKNLSDLKSFATARGNLDVDQAVNSRSADSVSDADELGFFKSVGSLLKKITWTNTKATLKTYFDTLYATAAQGTKADNAIPSTEKAAANGVATLGATSKIPSAQLPAIAITSVTVVASEVAQLALTAEEGDCAVRSDENKSYIHNGGSAGTMVDWTLLQTPTDLVLSVNSKTGAIVLTTTDVADASDKRYCTDAEKIIIGNTSGANSGDQDLSGLLVKASNLSDLVNAATARGNLGLGAAAIKGFKDEDDMASDSATDVPSQQSVKAYADTHIFTISEISANLSPAVKYVTYIVDTSGGDVTVSLPDAAAANDGNMFRVVVSDATNKVIITTVGGTQNVGGQISQVLVEADTGITVQANHGATKYEIVQDSRAKAPDSSVVFYGLTEAGAVGGYDRLASSTQDSEYSQTPSDESVGPVTGADTLLGGWVSDAGVIAGLISETNIHTIFKVKRTAGTAAAEFYVEYYHRTTGGSETLLGTTGITPSVSSATYVELEVSGIIATKNFLSTDYFVVKFYASKVGAGTDPTYDVQLEGTTPARIVIPVASSSINVDSLSGILSVAKGGTGSSTASDARNNLGIFNNTFTQVRCATTANITIATALNNGDVIDGITLATDDRVLVKDQTDASQNGIYIVAVSPARADDHNSDAEIRSGVILIRNGTIGVGQLYKNTNETAITVDTTDMVFERRIREQINDDRTITIKAAAGDFTTLSAALDWLAEFEISASATITIQIEDGTFTQTGDINITHPNGDRINIEGENVHNKSMTSIQSAGAAIQDSGTALYYHDVIINLDSVADIAADDYALIRKTSGGTNYLLMEGCHKVINVDDGNTRITVRIYGRNQVFTASGNVISSDVDIIKTVIDASSYNGFVVDQARLGKLENIVIVGDLTAGKIGLEAKNTGTVVLGEFVGITRFASKGIHLKTNSVVNFDFCYVSGILGYGIYADAEAIFYVTSGGEWCVVNGCSIGIGIANNSTGRFTGSVIHSNYTAGVYNFGQTIIFNDGKVVNNATYGVYTLSRGYSQIGGDSANQYYGNGTIDMYAGMGGFNRVGADRTKTSVGDTNTSIIIDSLDKTWNISVGQAVTGTDIPADTTVVSVDSASQITISQAATGSSNDVTFTFKTGHNPVVNTRGNGEGYNYQE